MVSMTFPSCNALKLNQTHDVVLLPQNLNGFELTSDTVPILANKGGAYDGKLKTKAQLPKTVDLN